MSESSPMETTIQDRLLAQRYASGFDYLRLVLSISIIGWHTIIVCYSRPIESYAWTSPWRPLPYFIVPSFFALSGFLVAGSLERVNNLPLFLTLRCIRIFPALCLEVVISALILGPLLTVLPLDEYFNSPLFSDYFLNVVGYIHYVLPGLFAMGKTNVVNVQLWTIPYELESYVVITLLALTRLVRYPRCLGIVALVYTAVMSFKDYYAGRLILDSRPPEDITVVCFMWGIFLYVYRHKIPYNLHLFLASLLVAWPALVYAKSTYVAALPIAYITVYIGLRNPKKIFLVSKGDYSYGLYLYGFPIQQAVYQLLPGYRLWYMHFPISLACTGLCAWLSWTFLESRILKGKKQILSHVDATCERMRVSLLAEEPSAGAEASAIP